MGGIVFLVACGAEPARWPAAAFGGGQAGSTDTGDPTASTEDGSSTSVAPTSTSDDESSEAGTTENATSGGQPVDCADLGPWRSSETFAGTSHPLPSFAVGSWFYVHTHSDGDERVLLSASPDASGALGPWQIASPDHGGGPHGFTAVAAGDDAFHFRNGHIARYVLGDDGRMHGDVELLENDVTDAFDGERYVWDSAVLLTTSTGPSAVLHLGGYSFAGSAYRSIVTRGMLPLGPRFDAAGPEHPNERPGKAAFVRTHPDGTGFVFMRDGADGTMLFRAAVDPTAMVGDWAEAGPLPAGTDNGRGDMFVIGGTLVAVQGQAVWASDVDEAGELGSWTAMPSLPEVQVQVHWGDGHLEGSTWGIIEDRVYLTGAHRVFDAQVLPRPCE
jgi:hypothetical protein